MDYKYNNVDTHPKIPHFMDNHTKIPKFTAALRGPP